MPLKILVVDDDPLLQNSLAYQLKTEGYTVVTASTNAEALALARAGARSECIGDGAGGLPLSRLLQGGLAFDLTIIRSHY